MGFGVAREEFLAPEAALPEHFQQIWHQSTTIRPARALALGVRASTRLASPADATSFHPVPQLPRITPLAPARFPQPIDHPDWLYDLKRDGWRCVAYVDTDTWSLVSRWGNAYKRFLGLSASAS